jgi:hypothetical protein
MVILLYIQQVDNPKMTVIDNDSEYETTKATVKCSLMDKNIKTQECTRKEDLFYENELTLFSDFLNKKNAAMQNAVKNLYGY